MRFHARAVRVVSLLALVAVINVCVFASGALWTGKLVTVSNRPILVNGGEAITGTTIVSGTQLTTPEAAGATVQLDRLGAVTIAPSSSVYLSFDSKNVTVNVASGYASLNTVEGVTGKVVGGNGGNSAPVPAGGNTAKNWGIAGVAVGSAAFVWAIIGWRRANDARDSAAAANAANAALAAQLAALRTCLAGQTFSPQKLCTSF
jgi:hypothetical protein